jgi:hypothetical protein
MVTTWASGPAVKRQGSGSSIPCPASAITTAQVTALHATLAGKEPDWDALFHVGHVSTLVLGLFNDLMPLHVGISCCPWAESNRPTV